MNMLATLILVILFVLIASHILSSTNVAATTEATFTSSAVSPTALPTLKPRTNASPSGTVGPTLASGLTYEPSVESTIDPSNVPSLEPSFKSSSSGTYMSHDTFPQGNNRSICITSDGQSIYGPSNCTDGEVMLLGNYVHVGIHNVASFGTENQYHSSYFNGQLGYIADVDRKGWLDSDGNPRYAGDYLVPGAPLEGNISTYRLHLLQDAIITLYLSRTVVHDSNKFHNTTP